MREVDPKTTNRAKAFELWMNATMPMVTMTKTFDITHLLRISKRKGVKLNMLMCYAVVKAASSFKEFYMLPVKDKLMAFDNIAINTIANILKFTCIGFFSIFFNLFSSLDIYIFPFNFFEIISNII